MATTMRGGGVGRERKGKSPSGSVINKSLKPLSSTSSSSLREDKKVSPIDPKSVPNYLKHTKSSGIDPSRQSKRTHLDSSAQKSSLNLRTSFDRPQPTSQVQKATRDVKPFRSSSFSNKTTSPSKSRKDGKMVSQVLSKSRTLNKGSLPYKATTKKDATSISLSTNKAPKPAITKHNIEDDLVNLDVHEIQSLPEISEIENEDELGDPIDFEVGVKQAIEIEQTGVTMEHHEAQRDVECGEHEHTDDQQVPNNVTTIVEENTQNELEKESNIVAAAAGKKKENQAYNDVIEETASKLMCRKNKVLALAGAFETVISLQDTNKNI